MINQFTALSKFLSHNMHDYARPYGNLAEFTEINIII